MSEPYPSYSWEPESVACCVGMKGAGTSVPTLPASYRNNYTVARTGVGAITIKFQDDPGPTFQGIGGFGFMDATPANAAGWSVVAGAYTARSGSTPAQLTVAVYNGSNAAADLAATTTLTLDLQFKQAPGVE